MRAMRTAQPPHPCLAQRPRELLHISQHRLVDPDELSRIPGAQSSTGSVVMTATEEMKKTVVQENEYDLEKAHQHQVLYYYVVSDPS